MKTITNNVFIYIVILAITFALLGPSLIVRAADLTSADLELSDPRPSQTGVNYTFTASNFSTGTTINCIQLELNDQADGGGSIPTGITTTGSALDASTDIINDGSWTVDNSTNGTLGATYAVGETPTGASGQIVWSGVTNGSSAGTTYFGIFNTYANVDCSTGGPIDTVTVAFVYIAGELVQLTIEPTLVFTCNGVTSGTQINGGPNTTLTTTCTGIDFGTSVSSSTNGVSAHDLDVTTNAQGGYALYIRHTQLLTNAASDTITNHTGTNTAPTSFPAAGTEAWGYTTEDSTLGGGTADRFTSAGGNKWSGFSTSNEIIGDLTTSTPTTQTHTVGHQVGVAANTEAGTYQNTIVYTVVATY